jgi:hypothetical protein
MTKDEASVKRMLEWVDSLRRQSDYGQHMNIPSGLSARTCWELANELEQFLKALEAKAEPVVIDAKMCNVLHRALMRSGKVVHSPQQEAKDEPVALETVYETIIHWDEGGGKRSRRELARRIVDLYTTPPQRKPLTDEEIRKWWASENGFEDCDMCKIDDFILVARAIEAAHGIKGRA